MPAASAELRDLAAHLAQASGNGIEKEALDLIQRTAMQIQQLSQGAAPRKTGKLANSIRITWTDKLSATIGPSVPYGVYQEFGTGTRGEYPGKIYEIRPKTKPYLVFKVNGKTVVARVVHHPGIKAHPYMRPATIAALEPFADQLAERGQLLIIKGPGSTL